jgi:hypothetical protein
VRSSGGTKITTFHYNPLLGPDLFDVDVHFSWDNEIWQFKEDHEVGFTIEVKNINPGVQNLTLSIYKICVRLKSENVYRGTREILSEVLSNQITTLVWMEHKVLISNTPRSFSFTVQAPEPYQSISKDESVELYYLIDLCGYYDYKEESVEGHGQIGGGPYLSNEGDMFGGVEDPVWITVKGTPQLPWLYVTIGIVIATCISAIVIALFIRRRRLQKQLIKPPSPSSFPSNSRINLPF